MNEKPTHEMSRQELVAEIHRQVSRHQVLTCVPVSMSERYIRYFISCDRSDSSRESVLLSMRYDNNPALWGNNAEERRN